MPSVHIGGKVKEYANPEPTAEKLGREYGKRIDWDKVVSEGRGNSSIEIPGLDIHELRRKYDPSNNSGYAPRLKMCSFKIPLDIRWNDYCRLRDQKAAIWIDAERRDGWDIVTASGIQCKPGPYPAFDLRDQVHLLDMRECYLFAHFTYRFPKTVRLELPGELFKPFVSEAEDVKARKS